MADVFPAIQRRFEADGACVQHCRAIFDSVAPENMQAPFVALEQSGGSDVSGFTTDADQIDAVFVIHSGSIEPAKQRRMVEAIQRAFDDVRLESGDARISCHRNGPADLDRENKTYGARISYTVFSTLKTRTPVVIG